MGLVNQDSLITSTKTPTLVFFQGLFYLAWTDTGSQLKLSTWGGDGPATAALGVQSSTAPSASTDGTLIYIVWTGINSKKVYVSTTSDGVKFGRTAFDYTTKQSTSVAYFNGNVYIAYTGTDSHSTVNLLSYPKGKPVAVATGATSGPSLAVYKGALWIAWAADDDFVFYSTTDGQHFTKNNTLPNMGTLGPCLVATNDSLFFVWNDDRDITVQGYEDTQTVTIVASSTSVPATAAALDGTLYIGWPQSNGNAIALFSIAESDITQASARREARPMDSSYITANLADWGVAITLSPQAVQDVVNGANVAAGITGALAAASASTAVIAAVLGMVSGILWAGSSVLALVNRGNGVTLMIPWSSFIPIPAPLGPGGIVIPVPAGTTDGLALQTPRPGE